MEQTGKGRMPVDGKAPSDADKNSKSRAHPAKKVPVSFIAALEQLPPANAVALNAHAQEHGFTGLSVSDRFQPWTPSQGQASFLWSVLAAAGQSTDGHLTGITVPGYRMHPATVAQASASLAAMYPGRHTLVVAPGNAIDEHVTGGYWPEAPERMARMFDAVEVIRKLFAASSAGKDTRHAGDHYRLETSRLWTMPDEAPPLLVWAAGPVTARRAGRVADGFVTGGAPVEKLEHLLRRFAQGAREGDRDPASSKRVLHLHLSWAATDEEAVSNVITHWPTSVLPLPQADVRSPFEVERLTRLLRPEHVAGRLLASSDPDKHRAYLQRLLDLGFNELALHNVGPNQREWIEVFGREVLPGLHT